MPILKVRSVEAGPAFELKLQFSDGSKGHASMADLVKRNPVFEPLQNPKVFAKAFVDHGVVTWPGDIDIAPEALYALAHKLPPATTFEQAKQNEFEVSLRGLRELAGFTQDEMAARMGIDQALVSRIERQEDAKLSTLRRYADAANAEIEVVAVVDGKRMRINL